MATLGRKSTLLEDKFIKAVQKKRTLNDSDLADVMGVTRMTVWNFKKKNPDTVKKAEEWLKNYDNMDFNNKITQDIFENLPEIKEWVQLMINRQVSKNVVQGRKKTLYNVCTYLKVPPMKLNPDLVADLVNTMKIKKRNNEIVPKGLSYTVLRDAIRSFFTLQLGISGELLSAKGVDMSATEGSGTFAHEKAPHDVRVKLEENINLVFKKMKDIHPDTHLDYDMMAVEALAYCKFMYYTATRGNASLKFKLNNPQNNYNTKIWTINLIDKGRKGGHHWEKILIDHSLEDFKQYLVKRFGLPYETLETTAHEIEYPFPIIRRYEDVTKLLKIALKRSGLDTPHPTHIWRHTFAQEALEATNGNYELTASIGGWDSTAILKKHYGQMAQTTKINGLRKMMGIKIEVNEEPLTLKW